MSSTVPFHQNPKRGLVFIDFEASSLMEGNFPIEVGISWFSAEAPDTYSTLIKPSDD